MTMHARWIPRLVLSGLSICLTLLLGELTVRILPSPNAYSDRIRHFADALIEPDALRSHRLRPGHSADIEGVTYRVSSIGTRGPEPRATHPHLRILTLGDSVTMGWGVREEEAYPAVLSRLLQDRGLDVEVINAGVVGYGTREEAATFEALDSALDPDVVVLGYFPNDPEDTETVTRTPGPTFSRLWTLLWPRLQSFEVRLGLEKDAVGTYQSLHTPGSASWLRVTDALARIGARCLRRSRTCVVAQLPALTGPADAWTDLHAQVGATAKSLGFRVFDLLPAVDGDPELRWVALDDAHPNAATHALYARVLADRLIADGLVTGH